LFSQSGLAQTTCQVATYAGKLGNSFGGDGGDATSANLALSFGGGLFMDTTKELFIADYQNNRVRQVSPNPKVMTTFAGDFFILLIFDFSLMRIFFFLKDQVSPSSLVTAVKRHLQVFYTQLVSVETLLGHCM
jgi:hypothetical protein